MKATTSTYVKFAAVAMLVAGPVVVQAERCSTNCTISGQCGVIAGTGSTPGGDDPVYTLNYVDKQLVYGDPEQPCLPPSTCSSDVIGDQNSNVLQLPGFGLTFSKLNGNPGFNHGVFSNKWGTACGTLVDQNNDGKADNIVVQLGAYAGSGGVPNVLLDSLPFPVKGLIDGYWLLEIDPAWTSYTGPLNFFTPVNTGANPPEIRLVCTPTGGTGTQQTDANGTLDVAVTQQTNAQGPGPCGPTAIPTATFWGYSAMTMLLMFAGMRLLRKRGFGDDFNLRA